MLWITGDTVLYNAVRRVPERLEIGTVPLHLGGVRFAVTGPLRHTMTAEEAADLCGLARPHTAVPIHYEGWAHFRQGRDAVERAFAARAGGGGRERALAAGRRGYDTGRMTNERGTAPAR